MRAYHEGDLEIPEPEPGSPTWPIVLSFAKLMEHKLSLNRHKGDREGWMNDDPLGLLERVADEYTELYQVIFQPTKAPLEAADIANFAMMVTDRVTLGKLLGPQNQSNTTM